MNEKSAFDPNQVADNAYVEPRGVLDQLNLPLGFVRFLRKNKKVLQIVGILVVIIVVVGSLYDSYRVNRISDAASALAISMSIEGEGKVVALQQVVDDFSGTASAFWASTELGHLAMTEGNYKEAGKYYLGVRNNLSETNPLYGLLTFGIAQAEEADKQYASAIASYMLLRDIEGYKDEGFIGMARVFEAQGKKQEAKTVYQEYLASFPGELQNEQLSRMIEEKITRLNIQ